MDTFRAVSMNQLDSELYEWVLQRQATETKLLQDNPPPGVLMVDDGGLDQGTAPAAAAGAGTARVMVCNVLTGNPNKAALLSEVVAGLSYQFPQISLGCVQ